VVEGLDVSLHQGKIDWSAIAQAGVRFCYVRASVGGQQVDSQFATNWKAAVDAGLIRGAYHFFWPLTASQDQADNFIDTVGTLQSGDLAPTLDLEEAIGASDPQKRNVWLDVPAEQRLPMIQNWLETVEQAAGMQPVIYTRQNFIESLLGDGVRQLADYPLWIAHYDVPQPTVPASWTSWNFWQYTEKGSVQGINGNVDRDRFNGSLSDLQALGKS
jgi:lysozyme